MQSTRILGTAFFPVLIGLLVTFFSSQVWALDAENAATNDIGYSVQAGAFTEPQKADQLVGRLKAEGIDALSLKRDNGVYVVRFGGFPSGEEARIRAQQLIDKKILSSYFIAPSAKAARVQTVTVNKPTMIKAENSKGAGLGGTSLAAKRARVLAQNKKISKRMAKGKTPELPKDLAEEAEMVQLALNTKFVTHISDKGYFAECFTKQESLPLIYCNLYFPNQFAGQASAPMRYVHYVQSVTQNVAYSLQRGNTSNFWIMALANMNTIDGGNGYLPVCSFIYDRERDQLTPQFHIP